MALEPLRPAVLAVAFRTSIKHYNTYCTYGLFLLFLPAIVFAKQFYSINAVHSR